MQAREFGEVLRSFAGLIDEVGNGHRASSLRTLADAVSGADQQPVSKVVGAVQKHWKASKRVPKYPAGLEAQLRRVGIVLTASGATKAANDCSALLKLFVGDPSDGVETFASNIAAAISTPPTTKKTVIGLDPAAIEEIADELSRVRLDNAKFDAALAELEARKLKKPDLLTVARRFLGAERTFKTAPEMIKAIRTRQMQDALQASRDRRIEKIAV